MRKLFGLATVLAAVVMAGATSAQAARAAMIPSASQSNVIQNGDFSLAGTANVTPAADWAQTDVTDNGPGCDPGPPGTTGASGAIDCNGPYVYISTADSSAPSCQPITTGTPFLTEDVPDGSDAYVSQQVTVPSSAELTFLTWGNYQASTGKVSVVTGGGTVTQLASIEEPLTEGDNETCTGAAAVEGSVNMSAYAGQTVTLRFEGASPNAIGAFVNYDDISLVAGTASGGSGGSGGSASTYLQVVCNLDLASGIDTCAANVANASSEGTSTPSGEVTFTSSGGSLLSSQCRLVPTPGSEGIASCTVQYRPADTSTAPTVTGTYHGDSTFSASTSSTGLMSGVAQKQQEEQQQGSDNDDDNGDDTNIPDDIDPGQDDEVISEMEQGGGGDADAQTNIYASQHAAQGYGDDIDDELGDDDDYADQSGVSPSTSSGIEQTETGDSGWGYSDTSNDDQSDQVGDDADTVYQQTSDDESDGDTAPLWQLGTDANGTPIYTNEPSTNSEIRVHVVASTTLGPLPSLVIAAISAKHPTATEIRAFDRALTLASSPSFSPAEAMARFSLSLAAGVGLHVIDHLLGYKYMRQLASGRALTIGSAKTILRPRHRVKVKIESSALGARVLRLLEVAGLNHKVTIYLKITVKHGHRTRTVRQAVHVI